MMGVQFTDQRGQFAPQFIRMREPGLELLEFPRQRAFHRPCRHFGLRRIDVPEIHRQAFRRLRPVHFAAGDLEANQQSPFVLDDPGLPGCDLQIDRLAIANVLHPHPQWKRHRRLNRLRKGIIPIHPFGNEIIQSKHRHRFHQDMVRRHLRYAFFSVNGVLQRRPHIIQLTVRLLPARPRRRDDQPVDVRGCRRLHRPVAAHIADVFHGIHPDVERRIGALRIARPHDRFPHRILEDHVHIHVVQARSRTIVDLHVCIECLALQRQFLLDFDDDSRAQGLLRPRRYGAPP